MKAKLLFILMFTVSTLSYAQGASPNDSNGSGKIEVTNEAQGKRTPIVEYHSGAKNHAGEKEEGDSIRVSLGHSNDLRNDLIPVVFFVFLIVIIIGGKYFSSRNEQRRLEVLKLMLEKGQPVPEAVVNQILSNPHKSGDPTQLEYRKVRNTVGFTVAGVALMGYAIISQNFQNKGVVIPGLIFLCLGVGGLAGLYFHKGSKSKGNSLGSSIENQSK